MLAEPEHYKGIIYVRISTLPGDQKIKIRESYNREAIVKILKDNALMNDCILYTEYLMWYKQFKGVSLVNAPRELPLIVERELVEMDKK